MAACKQRVRRVGVIHRVRVVGKANFRIDHQRRGEVGQQKALVRFLADCLPIFLDFSGNSILETILVFHQVRQAEATISQQAFYQLGQKSGGMIKRNVNVGNIAIQPGNQIGGGPALVGGEVRNLVLKLLNKTGSNMAVLVNVDFAQFAFRGLQ